MKELSPRKAAEVAILAREIERAEPEFRGLVEAMTEDEQAELVALMWIGRGAFEAEDYAEAVATARAEASAPTADYLLGSPHLPDHIEAGLEALGYSATGEEDELL
ncbi:DUF3775 domain-containing protein [Chachezhania antarctica]|uniref:DUF3775 domain-containing protein n=1 Tax=Chachezhania antarctica TaxID=2340860 RepID=UPI000EB072CA|nr:DUF3775 domain-containing protein [Chachezhania antarctica]|tara:strand:+ start:665 stop:982 length:318 start_codon:yes stop_codon:yes gene_type:complete